MARPNWEYIRVDVLLPEHPKLDGLTSGAKWTLIEMWLHCGRHRTDGFVRDAAWRKIGTFRSRASLVARGLAEAVPGGYQMHDYLGHQRSRTDIDELQAKRSSAGKRSAAVRASVAARVQHPAEQTGSKPATEAEAEAEADLPVTDVINRPNGHLAPATRIDQMIITEIHGVTGRRVDAEWARKIRGHILEGRSPADPMAYVRQAIRTEPDPAKRFLPHY